MPAYRYERFRPSLPRDIPGTNFIMAANVIGFVLDFLRLLPTSVYDLFVSNSMTVWRSPWTLFTYPLISRSVDALKFISLLLGLWWLYLVGGLLERSFGTRRFLTLFFVFSAISAFFLSVGGLFLGAPVGFGELICPLVDLTVIWAMMEPEAPVILFVFPMQLRWLALITCLLLLFQFGNPLGFFALGGPLVAYFYTRALRGASSRPPKSAAYSGAGRSKHPWSFLNPFEWYRRWKFKRRFKRLWGD